MENKKLKHFELLYTHQQLKKLNQKEFAGKNR